MAAIIETGNASGPAPDARWSRLIPDGQWAVFAEGARIADEVGAPFLVGGTMALATYTGRWRNTKDIDFIVRRADSARLVQALLDAGFDDYYAHEAYDRSWIFRSYKDEVILDIIWELPNHRVEFDEDWFTYARPLRLHGRVFQAVPAEELIWIKLYVLQRGRCDWTDVLNVLASAVVEINWERLTRRMERDLPLLQGALAVFNWLCPARAAQLPEEVRTIFALPEMETDDPDAMERRRVRALDSRPWFAPHQPVDVPMEL